MAVSGEAIPDRIDSAIADSGVAAEARSLGPEAIRGDFVLSSGRRVGIELQPDSTDQDFLEAIAVLVGQMIPAVMQAREQINPSGIVIARGLPPKPRGG